MKYERNISNPLVLEPVHIYKKDSNIEEL